MLFLKVLVFMKENVVLTTYRSAFVGGGVMLQ